ncbi:hypothetical protein K9U40_00015 [Xanthobacter autotrophicus]|uniref:hypothetical protein n=2 Tax=Xanthobacter TaxID=279 RepID=UPI0024AC6964|nr:hypothetical protein [Xanthobacter autotrophicus]MDI4662728.1 hypothetical protein [Xanthobacter autotrophicus]
MAQAPAAGGWSARAWRPSLWQVAWLALLLAVVASFFPLRFTATTTIAFDVGAQPPAMAARGVAQVLASRELAYKAVDRLGSDDRARLAGGFGIRLPGARADAEERPEPVRAAWRLLDDLNVTTINGGRGLRLTLSAPTPSLALRAADAYVAAFLALDAETRAAADEPATLPTLRHGESAHVAFLPDPPRPLALALLLAAAVTLLLAQRNAAAEPEVEGPLTGTDLPLELKGSHRIAWLGGPDGGLEIEPAVARLAAQMARSGTSSLVILTSDDLPEASAACAVALARRLSDEARVALVALDGASENLATLVADPWSPGMSELLFGVAGFGETIHRDAHSRAHVIPPGRDARGGPAVIGAERLALVLESLKRTYDYVVVAAPSLSGANGGERLSALDPLVVCLSADTAPSTAAVESFDALAEQRFARVVMLCLALPPAENEGAEDEGRPLPTIDVVASRSLHRETSMRYAGAA